MTGASAASGAEGGGSRTGPPVVENGTRVWGFTTSSTDGNAAANIGTPSENGSHSSVGQRNAAIGGGKLGKSKRSWGDLPSKVVQPAVDSFSFWPEYTLIIEPSKHHASSVDDLHSARTTPSSPTYPTFFRRALGTTAQTCLPCRMNSPDRLGLYPANASHPSYSNKFGRIPTCQWHENAYCANCLRGFMRRLNARRERDNLNIAPLSGRDYDDQGYRLPEPINLTCADCRNAALGYYIHEVLHGAARGGPIYGDADLIIVNSVAAQDYVLLAQGHAIETAKIAVEEQWFNINTVHDECASTAARIQGLGKYLKKCLITRQQVDDESFNRHLNNLICELWDAPLTDLGPKINSAGRYFQHRMNVWQHELAEGVLEDDKDDDEKAEVPTDDYWISQARQAAISLFCRDRMRFATWVSPVDEVEGYFAKDSAHTPLGVLELRSLLPHDVSYHPTRTYDEPLARTDMDLDSGRPDTVFPTSRLLHDLEDKWEQTVHRYLARPIAQGINHLIEGGGWTIEDFDKLPLQTSDILQLLRTVPECWEPFVRTQHNRSRSRGHSTSRPSRRSRARSASPFIEVVADDTESSGTDFGTPYGLEAQLDDEDEGDEAELDAQLMDMFDSSDTSAYSDEEEEEQVEVRDGNHVSTYHHFTHANQRAVPTQMGKRKLEADDAESETEPAPKRRLSEDGAVITQPQAPAQVAKASSTSPTQTASPEKSEQSTETSSSDPLPKTPEDPVITHPHSSADLDDKMQVHPHNANDSLDTETHMSAKTDDTRPPLRQALSDLPHIPFDEHHLGPRTDAIIQDLINHALEPLRECKCKICERGKVIQAYHDGLVRLGGGSRRRIADYLGAGW